MKIAVLQKYNKAVESLADVTTINKLWYAEKHGYKVLYMWEKDIRKNKDNDVKQMLAKILQC